LHSCSHGGWPEFLCYGKKGKRRINESEQKAKELDELKVAQGKRLLRPIRMLQQFREDEACGDEVA
jgi:hypothetical protein